jgi:plastocyanin
VQVKYWVVIVTAISAGVLLGHAFARPHRPITIVDFAYQPASVSEEIKSPITWSNTGTVTHTVTFDNAPINSDPIGPGQTFSSTLPTVGHYTYHCTIHPSMIGAIDAQPQQMPPPPTPRAWLPIVVRGQD